MNPNTKWDELKYPTSSHFAYFRRKPNAHNRLPEKVYIFIPPHPTSSQFAKADSSSSPAVTSTRKSTFHPTSFRGGRCSLCWQGCFHKRYSHGLRRWIEVNVDP